MIEYILTRSNRKTASISITKDAEVSVRAPIYMPKREIDRFVLANELWIRQRLAHRKNLNSQKAGFKLTYGSRAVLRGKSYPITRGDSPRLFFDGESFTVAPNLSADEIKFAVKLIYKTEAKREINKTVFEYSKQMGVFPKAVKITEAKKRWGSCSGKNSLNFSWRLVMAADDVISYVVVHELAHIIEHNHSAAFWDVVKKFMPEYKEAEKELVKLQKVLSQQDWD
ncbi:MAG: M48 family metallopeptidase [Clostridiales bacterium]|jgi:predicted metal-dependent hydrolase|nr:M48 family metallopeptidase [Clostridiales bacterium]